MNSYKDIGGFFELECGHSKTYHNDAIAFNSGRNALRYIIKAYKIKKIAVPYYTCNVVWQALKAENCEMAFYEIDNNFMPKKDFSSEDFILYNNYFGICNNNVNILSKKYPNLIIDNAQSFYSFHQGLASFYSPRKFFGLPDGGYAFCDKRIENKLEKGVSYDRCSHLLKRLDRGANFAYSDFQQNDESLIDEEIKLMSNLTSALSGNINYELIKKNRLENFELLDKNLKNINEIIINLSPEDVPMVYPFLVKNDNLRKKLIQNKIFIAEYWPEIEKVCLKNSYELYLKKYLIPLPIDQRYKKEEMINIIKNIKELS